MSTKYVVRLTVAYSKERPYLTEQPDAQGFPWSRFKMNAWRFDDRANAVVKALHYKDFYRNQDEYEVLEMQPQELP